MTALSKTSQERKYLCLKNICFNGKDRKEGVAIRISHKTDFKIKAIKKDKEGNYLMVNYLYMLREMELSIAVMNYV